jgi:hypothetical protein
MGVAETMIDFQLRVYGGMDFSRILGFPLEVTAFAEEPAEGARISGWITVPDSPTVFRIESDSASGSDLRCVRFLNTVVEPDVAMEAGIPLTKPVTLPMSLGVNEVPSACIRTKGSSPSCTTARCAIRRPASRWTVRPAGDTAWRGDGRRARVQRPRSRTTTSRWTMPRSAFGPTGGWHAPGRFRQRCAQLVSRR